VIELSHDEIQELLGAFALNATDDDERDVVERHLDTCPRCRGEVADFREVAALLSNTGSPAPDGVWDRIVGALEEAPPPLRLPLPMPPDSVVTPLQPSRRTVSVRAVAALAAAAALLVGVLAFSLDRDDAQTPAPGDLATAAHLALNDPDAREVKLTSADGAVAATAVVLPDGQGYLLAESLPALDDDRTYQLWGAGPGPVISLGLMGNEPKVVSFTAARDVELLMVTAEDAGGVPVSSNDPVITGTFA
jgi:hypothetical protein